MVYSICFIPLNAVELFFTGRLITNLFKFVVLKSEEFFMRRKKVKWIQRKILVIQIISLVIIILLHAWFLNATIMNNDSFMTCIYFVYITLSTIGFGDISFDVNYLISLDAIGQLFMGMADPILFYLGFSMLAALIDNVVSLRTNPIEAEGEE